MPITNFVNKLLNFTGARTGKTPLERYQSSQAPNQAPDLTAAYDKANEGVTQAENTQREDVTQQYAQLRRALQARQNEASRQSDLSLARASNASQGFGGAEEKMKQENQRQLQEGFGAQESQLGGEEAQVKSGLASEAAQRRYATAERLGGEAFAQAQFESERR